MGQGSNYEHCSSETFQSHLRYQNSKNHRAKTGDKLSEQISFLSFFADFFSKLSVAPGYDSSFEKWNGRAEGGILMWLEDHVWIVALERTNTLLVQSGRGA